MKFLKLAKKNREMNPESWEALYESEIVRRIRQKYSVNQELAILRQRDEKPEEFKTYNKYVEACKAAVKSVMNDDI